jgi:hypothetical protein
MALSNASLANVGAGNHPFNQPSTIIAQTEDKGQDSPEGRQDTPDTIKTSYFSPHIATATGAYSILSADPEDFGLAEWFHTGASRAFIRNNVSYGEGSEAAEVLGRATMACNPGMTLSAASNLHYYANNSDEYWAVTGVDPLNGFKPSRGTQVKLSDPRHSKEGKVIKYETPQKAPATIFVPFIDVKDALGVINRYNLTATAPITDMEVTELVTAMHEDLRAFWFFFLDHPGLPLVITEGAKKVGAAVSAGYVTISLPGIWNGRESQPKELEARLMHQHRLRGEIAALVQTGRPVVFAFDSDTADKTVEAVKAATFATAELIAKAGAIVSIATWDSELGKGIDDLIADSGVDAFVGAIAAAEGYSSARVESVVSGQLTRTHDQHPNTPGDVNPALLPATGIIALKAPKGWGKTQHFLKPLVADGDKVIALTHRTALGNALANQLDLTYRDQLDRGNGRFIGPDGLPTGRIALCVDSLLTLRPSDYEGATVVIDEVDQVIQHLLSSQTIGSKGNRAAILSQLTRVLQAAKRVIGASADLSDSNLEYLSDLLGPNTPVHLIVSDTVAPGFDCYRYECPDTLIGAAIAAYGTEVARGANGGHIALAADTKATIQQVAKLVRDNVAGAIVLEVTSDTSGGEIERDFIANPTQWIADQTGPVFIAFSPSLGTGVSIENPNFAGVYAIFTGASIAPSDCLQAINRVRTKCDRHYYAANTGRPAPGALSSKKAAGIKAALKARSEETTAILASELETRTYDRLIAFTWATDPNINAFCRDTAYRNRAMAQFGDQIAYLLEAEGNTPKALVTGKDEETKAKRRVAKEAIKDANIHAIATAAPLTVEDHRTLDQKENLTPAERHQLTRYNLEAFYHDEVTPELVASDNKGKRRAGIRAMEELLDVDLAKDRDLRDIEAVAANGGTIAPQDMPARAIAAQLRIELGLLDWLDRKEPWTNSDYGLMALHQECIKRRGDIKRVLGVSLAKQKPQQLLGTLLGQIGVKVAAKLKKEHGKPVRYYAVDTEALAENLSVMDKREVYRDELKQDMGSAEYRDILAKRDLTDAEARRYARTVRKGFDALRAANEAYCSEETPVALIR